MNSKLRTLIDRSKNAWLRTKLFILNFFQSNVIGCRIVQFLRSTKVVLIKFCALGIVKRMWLVISHIGIGIGAILFVAAFIAGIFATFIFGGVIIAIEIILLIPYCIIWLLTGKWWFWNIMTYLYDETILFELMKFID